MIKLFKTIGKLIDVWYESTTSALQTQASEHEHEIQQAEQELKEVMERS